MIKWLIGLLFTTVMYAQVSIYKVMKDESIVYLFPTVNLLRASDYPLHPKYEELTSKADQYYFETDFNALIEQKTYNYFLNQLKLPSNQTLAKVLNRQAYFKLSNIARNYGLKIKEYEKYNVTLLLSMLEFTIRFNHAGVNAEVTQHYLKKALKENKEVHYLSSVYAYLDKLNLKNSVHDLETLDPYLKRLEYINKEYESIIQNWKFGRLHNLEPIFNIYGSTAYLHEKWIKTIEKLLDKDKTTAIFLHASAFSQEFDMVQRLKDLGYKVEQL